MSFLILGYGRMGKLVHKVLNEKEERVWGIAETDSSKVPPGVTSPGGMHSKGTRLVGVGDILIDVKTAICFTSPEAGYETTKTLLKKGIDTIVGTTKWYLNSDKTVNTEMIAELDDIAKGEKCRFVYASNFSVGMQAFWQNLKQLAPVLAAQGYDVAIVEEHHTRKADISGTAMTIGQILIDAYPGKTKLKVGDFDSKIEDDEISVGIVRAGDIPGTHRVIFESPVDRIVLEHVVRDRMIFARGAVDTAYWAKQQEPGAYSITDRLG